MLARSPLTKVGAKESLSPEPLDCEPELRMLFQIIGLPIGSDVGLASASALALSASALASSASRLASSAAAFASLASPFAFLASSFAFCHFSFHSSITSLR